MDKLTQLVLLLGQQLMLQDELHSKRLLHLQSQIGADLSKHRRDQHNLFWDHEMFLASEKKRNTEIDELYKKLNENKKRIAELKQELASVAAA